MKNSKDDFLELINLYLDNEASPRDLKKISALIAENEDFASMFYEYRSIYIATSKHYSKPVKLQKLPRVKLRRPSVFMGNLEWCAVLLLMLVCAFLLKQGISASSDKYIKNLADKPAFAEDSLTMKVRDFFVETYTYYTILEFDEK